MNQNRQPEGIPTGGQYATTPRGDAAVTLDAARAHLLDLDDQALTQRRLVNRLEAIEQLDGLPEGATVQDLHFYEDPNPDGSFDVVLETAYDANGEEIDSDCGTESAIAAGYYTAGRAAPYGTDFDIWRDDPTDVNSPIDVDKARAWAACAAQGIDPVGACPDCRAAMPGRVPGADGDRLLPGATCPACGHLSADWEFEHDSGIRIVLEPGGTLRGVDSDGDTVWVHEVDSEEWESFNFFHDVRREEVAAVAAFVNHQY